MDTKPNRPGPRYQALLDLLRTAETIWNGSRVFFSRWNLSPSQFNILNLLDGQPEGLSQTELGRELIMHRSNVTGLVDRLEGRQLVLRRAHAVDRRAWQVVLTPAGHRLLAEILPHYYRVAEQVWTGIPVPRVRALLADLHRLSDQAARLAGEYREEQR
ncbi:MAG: MarR family winged helix-turn-helix transcriptional regulator [Limisphaerales bacterium]